MSSSDATNIGVLTKFIELCPMGMVHLDRNGMVRLWSAGAARILGWSAEEMEGKPLPFTLLPGRSTLRCDTKSTMPVDLEFHFEDCRDAQGASEGLFVVFSDKYDSRFRELLEAAPDAIIKVDQGGRIVLLNAATERLFGYERSELLGQMVEILIPAAARAGHQAHRASFWTHPSTRPMGRGLLLSAQRKDHSEFPVEISLSPVKSVEGFRVTAIIRDVTDRKEAEEKIKVINAELEERSHQLERANRLKSEFLASMSHELRTPLHTIIGFSELLAEGIDGTLTDTQNRFVGHILRDSLHLLELINDILDLSKIEAGRMIQRRESFSVAPAIDEVLASIRPAAEQKLIEVLWEGPEEFFLDADRVQFKEVLFNLLSNAVSFTPERGTIRIAVPRELQEPGFLCFGVSDTGVGIPAEEHTAIFDKFYQIGSTTKGVREGTGLGLAITKQLVEHHGGRIWVKSQPGSGSCFYFTLPLAS